MATTVKPNHSKATATSNLVSQAAACAAAVVFVLVLRMTYGLDLSAGFF
jgi:hypothetical protein